MAVLRRTTYFTDPRILVPLSIVRKFDTRTPFRSVVMALDIWQLPPLAPPLRGITRKRDTGIIKPFTEARKREFPFTTFTYQMRQDARARVMLLHGLVTRIRRLKFDTGSSTLDTIFHVRCSGMELAFVLITSQRNGLCLLNRKLLSIYRTFGLAHKNYFANLRHKCRFLRACHICQNIFQLGTCLPYQSQCS